MERVNKFLKQKYFGYYVKNKLILCIWLVGLTTMKLLFINYYYSLVVLKKKIEMVNILSPLASGDIKVASWCFYVRSCLIICSKWRISLICLVNDTIIVPPMLRKLKLSR